MRINNRSDGITCFLHGPMTCTRFLDPPPIKTLFCKIAKSSFPADPDNAEELRLLTHLTRLSKYLANGVPYLSIWGQQRIRFTDMHAGSYRLITEVSLQTLGIALYELVLRFQHSESAESIDGCARSIPMRLILAELSAHFADKLWVTNELMSHRNWLVQFIAYLFYSMHERVLLAFSIQRRRVVSPNEEEMEQQAAVSLEKRAEMCYADILFRSFSLRQIAQLNKEKGNYIKQFPPTSLEIEPGCSWGGVLVEGIQTFTAKSLQRVSRLREHTS